MTVLTTEQITALGEPKSEREKRFMQAVENSRDIGFGRMLQMISIHWFKLDPLGAISLGPCWMMRRVEGRQDEYHYN